MYISPYYCGYSRESLFCLLLKIFKEPRIENNSSFIMLNGISPDYAFNKEGSAFSIEYSSYSSTIF